MTATDGLLETLIEAAREAGRAALALRDAGLRTEAKADESPVTEADRRAEAIILQALARAAPDTPVVAEESHAAGRVPARLERFFFLVDPIDGTREFIAGRDEFTVNIALIDGDRPVLGVVYAPACGELYAGKLGGAFLEDEERHRRTIAVRTPAGPLRALASRSHRTAETNDYLSRHGIADVDALGSSLKFCRLAAGMADLYPCFGPTMEWDTAAGQAVLEAAGGFVREPDGRPLAYGKRGRPDARDFLNPKFVAGGALSLPGC